jgi:hypothetical protein
MANCHFFATASDLFAALGRFEELHAIQYVEMGHLDTHTPRTWSAVSAIPNLGRAPSGHAITEPMFLVMHQQSSIAFRAIPQRDDETKFAIDQLENPDSAVFSPGGLFAPDVLVSGRISTTGVTESARRLTQAMVRAVTKGFRRVKTFWLGPAALTLFEQGARLTMAVQMPREYDLSK